jgi:hypothetical protein
VLVCDVYGNQVAPNPGGLYGIGTNNICPGSAQTPDPNTGGMAIWTGANNTIPQGTAVHWTVSAPAGLTIASVYIPHMYSEHIDDGTNWGGGFFWQGGSGNVNTFNGETGWSSATTSGPAYTWPAGGTPYFGWQVICGVSSCSNGGSQWLSVESLQLNVAETSGPSLTAPDGLWQTSGWIRGTWPLHFYGDSPSGLCSLSSSLNGQGGPGASVGGDGTIWHECSSPAVDQNVNTAQYGQGALPLTISALDSAQVPVSYSKTVDVDNQTPTISLSGPTDEPSTAGTQYVTASGGAGPSGVSGISCSVDNSPPEWYASSSAQVPVSGVGQHQVSCYSENRALNTSGEPASSPVATWQLSIRVPTESGISFTRVVDALRCQKLPERVKVPAKYVTVRRDHKLVRVRERARTKIVKVSRCKPRTVRRKTVVTTAVRRHGKTVLVKRTKLERVVVLPHVIGYIVRRVAYGRATMVSGWLGTCDGTALAVQPVSVMTAPDNGQGQFTLARTVITASDGSWSAQLPAGPSRLVEAAYPGASTTEPATSQQVRIVVPAVVRLHIRPNQVPWGGTIHISGRVLGAYIPGGRQQLLRLRIGAEGISSTVGIPDIASNGRFRTTWTFHPGVGVVTYWFSVSTLNEADYPFAPAGSRRVTVTVGPGSK